MHKYAQIQAQRRKDAQNTCKCGQILANTRRYTQIRANTSRYTHIRANTRKYMQTRPNTHRYTDAHRKDTANSHEQLQGAPFSSVRRHVPASLIIITRFPFTYQTGSYEVFKVGDVGGSPRTHDDRASTFPVTNMSRTCYEHSQHVNRTTALHQSIYGPA